MTTYLFILTGMILIEIFVLYAKVPHLRDTLWKPDIYIYVCVCVRVLCRASEMKLTSF